MDKFEFVDTIRNRYMNNADLSVSDRFEAYDALFHTGQKLLQYFEDHEQILISVSGGSDSNIIIHLICTYFPEYLEKCHFVWVNTGLEYQATKRHLEYLEERYGIHIEKIRGKSVVWAVRTYGVPILNKDKSHNIDLYNRDMPSGYKYLFGEKDSRFALTPQQAAMVHYIKDNGIKISAKCCEVSKKKPLYQYIKEHGIDLNVTGERKAEGGIRATAHHSCFEQSKNHVDKYMPLWWWSDRVKSVFKEREGIRYSDCYEVYGMRRTGCVGCPFSLTIADDLTTMYIFEPQLYKACMKVFGESYRLVDQFGARKRKCIPDLPEKLFDF